MAEDRARVLSALGELAPLELAENWDNVGIIVDANGPVSGAQFSRAFLTVDLTPHTFAEAVQSRAELIVAYHPPIFSGLKRLRRDAAAERLMVEAIQRGLMIYSPHTALDAARGGMGDWLASACGPGDFRPIAPVASDPLVGAGRLVTLAAPISLAAAVERIKTHLGLERLRLATPVPECQIQTLAVCPGAGGSLFASVRHADLFLTGEMRHHDVLGRNGAASAVVLTDHTNCERGYLPVFAERLRAACPALEVLVSNQDRDPLQIV